MADNNLFDQGLEPAPATKTASPSGNLFDQGLSNGGAVSSAPVPPPVTSSNLFDAGLGSPNNGQTEAPASPKFDYQDPNKPWYSRAFSWLNTPLTESLFGLPEDRPGAGGFERGVEHIASGLTSPLSVALTAATFGTGGLVESAGVTALKEAGLTAAEIADATKASQVALDATRALKPIEPAIQDALTAGGHDLGLLQRAREATGPLNLDTQFGEPALQKVLEEAGFSDEERAALAKASDTIIDARQGFKPVEAAVKEAGVDPALWKRAQSALYDQGLTEHDLLGGNMVERGAFQILHHTVPDLPIAVTARAAKTANALLNAGFTLQQFETASAMSPRFLDALKEGDYDKAWEYGTEAFAGGALGVLGASHALHSAGELFKPLIEPDKAMRPSDEYLAIQRANQEREAMHAVAEQHAINLSTEAKRILGHEEPRAIFGDSKEVKAQKDLELASVLNHVVVGGDAEKAATWSDVLAEAAGRNEEPAIARPNNGQTANPDVQKLAQEPQVGTPIETPSREGTKVVHSNDAGEVRVGSDGRPIVWLSPEAWEAYNRVAHPGNKISGVSYSPDEAADISKKLLKANEPGDAQKVLDLFWKAQEVSKQGLLTTAKTGTDVTVAAEELQHTHQRELAQDGEVRNLFKPQQWSKLSGVIPAVWTADMDRLGYDKDPVTRVAETAAQFRSGKAAGIVPDTDITRFLDSYYSELEAKYGKEALDSADRINEIAAQHVKDIYENRRARPSTPEDRLANQATGNRQLSGVEAGRETGTPEVGPREPQTGLSSKENEEFTPPLSRPNNGLFAKDRDNLAPTWYLKSNQLIDSRMSGPMPADTVLKMLENNGVKPDELKYTGLSDLLREKGQEKVSPDEVKKFLDANNLQVQEVTHLPVSDEEMSRRIASGEGNVSGKPTRFGSHTLPGGSNYREMLLTLPDTGASRPITFEQDATGVNGKPRFSSDTAKGRAFVYFDAPTGSWASYSDRGTTHKTGFSSPEEAKAELSSRQQPASLARDRFESSHWDEPNVVGHVRFNDRTGPNGEKLLHLEELQSDWHQKGRTGGYDASPEERQAASDALDKAIKKTEDVSHQVLVKATGDTRTEAFGAVRDHPDWAERWDVTNPADIRSIDEYAHAIRDLEQVKKTVSGGVPDAPFKKTWPEFLMKRMIRYASENGYDGISWTPGEEQAARYDLSKQIDAVHYTDIGDGEYHVDAIKDGSIIASKAGTPQELEDFVGKDVTKKIVSGEGDPLKNTPNYRKLSGVDLKVGGEGMKGFYDKIVPEVANKLGKQFGAKVQSTKIETASDNPYSQYEGPAFGLEDLRKIATDHTQNSRVREQADAVVRAMRGGESYDTAIVKHGSAALAAELKGDLVTQKQTKSVPYFPITDSMRESVMKQGQPLFAKESPNNGQDPQLAHQIDTNVFKNQPKDYQDLVMESLRRNAAGELSDREIAASKKLREEDGRNYEIGSANDLIHTFLENHLHRIYEEDNPKGKVILSNAKAGKFATNVSQARQQVYDSQLTALLKSPKKIMLDPIKAVSMDRGDLIKAAANRQLIDNLRDKFTRASDGRPAVVLSGSGQVVSGQNGEDPSIFVDPNRVRKINIDPKVVDQLTKSGDLQRFLDDGTIRDITPYVHPNNIQAAIERLEEQSTRKEAQYDQVGNNKLLTQIMYLKSMLNNKDFSGLKDFNDALEKKYAWDPQDYVSLANNAMKGWNFVTNSPDGNAVFVRSDIKVHPEFAEYLKNRLGLEPSDIAKHPIGKALLGAGTKLKQTLLSLSPFHMVQEALRGIMVGVNPFHITGPDILSGEKVDPSDPNSPTIIRKLVENNFTTGTDYKAQQSSSEGLSSGGGLLNKAPGVGKVIGNSLNWYQDFLFKRYIPALKARAGELLFHEYQRLHPDWSVDRVAKAAATHANDTFGGINWKAMGRSATTQDWGRLMFLAPDWLESEMRSGARLFNKEEGGLGRAQVAKMALGLWGIARVLNLVTTGNAHYEAPFGLAVKNKEGKETVFSIRTLPTDLLHAASDPVGFVKGRLSPTVRMGEELVSGRDQFGRKLQPYDLWVDVFRNMAPIPLQAVGQAISGTGPEIGNIGQAVKAVGGTAQTYQTPAQKLAADLASSHTESGPIDPAQMARHSRVIQLEDQARAGEISWPDLYKLAYQTDQISESELKKIQENVKATHGMDASMASLFSRASRLPAKEFLDLWDVTNPSERAALAPLVSKVQKRYLTKAKKEMTPEERAKDPVFQRLVRMIPPSPVQQQNSGTGPQSYVAPPIIPPAIQKEVSYLYTATHPRTGHRVGSNDGQNWVDHQTGEPVNG